MTNEEAIELLHDVKTDAVYRLLSNEKNAIEMAIKALEQPQIIRCKDCINQGMNDCPMWEGMITEDYMWCCEGEKK